MTHEESLLFCNEISEWISRGGLTADLSPDADLRPGTGFPQGADLPPDADLPPETERAADAVIEQLSGALLLRDRAGEVYIAALKRNARSFDAAYLRENPYLSAVPIREARSGSFRLTKETYARGELFQYAEPDLRAEIVTPKIGFFTEDVQFPGIFEGGLPWMSVCPSEISSMIEPVRRARGRVLALGLGLGYYPFMAARKSEVESVTVVERCPEIIELFRENILPVFPNREKIRIVCDDAYAYLESLRGGEYDLCFADIWEGASDGADAYIRIRELARRLSSTEFSYWIEDEIRWFLVENYG